MTIKEFRAFLHRANLTADWLGDDVPILEKRYYLQHSLSGQDAGEFFVDSFGVPLIHVRLY